MNFGMIMISVNLAHTLVNIALDQQHIVHSVSLENIYTTICVRIIVQMSLLKSLLIENVYHAKEIVSTVKMKIKTHAQVVKTRNS